ncbi:MAG: DegT/DnrJ/EryC1/StrS family aminotransferase [Cyclobacteriaceae bacterium]
MINVTKTFLPPIEEYIKLLREIWAREHITNHGKCILELEKKLKEYLGVKHLFAVNNGTTALQIAIKALNISGEVITTPFSYVATTSSIVWENCIPVFADISKNDLCLDPKLAEKKITKNTSAILATHVYGIPCDVQAFEELSVKYGIKVIYDAAHAFGVRVKNNSVLNWGDISTLSFHATKVFHTVEGGALITNNDEVAHRIEYMRNFGHNGPEQFWGCGINGKVSEFHAAMGLVNLKYIDNLIASRKEICDTYNHLLEGSNLSLPTGHLKKDHNYSYYPVVFRTSEQAIKVLDLMKQEDMFPRRYFYPSLNLLPYVENKNDMPIAEDIATRVLCLPLYVGLKAESIERICEIVKSVVN